MRWPSRKRKAFRRDAPPEAPPGMVYGFRRDGSPLEIAVVENHYREKMARFDALPPGERKRVANSTTGAIE